MTRFFYFLSGIFFVLCKISWACLCIVFDVLANLCDHAEEWCEARRQRCIDRLKKPIRPNIRRVL